MRKTLCSALVAFGFASPALAEPGFYGELRGGGTEVETMAFSDRATADLTVNPGTGWALEGVVGYRFEAPVRVALAAGYQRSSIKGTFQENVQVTIPCGTLQPCLDRNVNGRVAGPSLFAMAYYDIPMSPALTLSLGGGLGMQRVDLAVHTIGRLNSGTQARYDIVDAGDTVFAGRASAELAYNVGHVDLTLGYTYAHTAKTSLAARGAFIPFTFRDNLTTHGITGGVRFTF